MKRSTLPIALLIISILAVLFLLAYSHFFLYPQITATVDRQLISETQRSADALATHFKHTRAPLQQGNLPPLFLEDAKSLIWKIHAEKIRLFSPQGETIYSSDPSEIGRFNSHAYFHTVIANGKAYSSIIAKESLSAEGVKKSSEVVEAYTPLMDAGEFLGALEIYHDVSKQKDHLRQLIAKSSNVIYAATAVLLLTFLIFFWRDHRNRNIRKLAEETQLVAESERKYRDLFENAMDSLFILDDNFRYIDANPMATQVFGYSHAEFLQMSVFDVIPVDQAPRSQEEFEALQKRGSYKNFIGQIRTKDGRWLDVEVNSSAIIENGQIVGSRDVVRDITLRKKMERDFSQARNLDALGILAGGIAHDFNNLMTAILGNISLAKRLQPGDVRHEKHLTIAENAISRAKDLTDQLLTFSQGGPRQKKATSLAELVETSATFPLTGSSVKCEFNLPQDLKAVLIDSNQISQVIQNLILNAREAMPQGGHITISGENTFLTKGNENNLPEGDYVGLTIIDDGSGIDEKDLAQIFDPYFSTKERDTRKGMGLGLSICHSIIINHQGSIEVESHSGQGTRFQILLPATNDPVIEENIGTTDALQSPLNILLMDDEELIREVLTDLLEYDGHHTTCAIDGSEAISLYRHKLNTTEPFDLVILDLTIPGGMGGVEALKGLVALDPEVIALVSSGYAKDPAYADHLGHGFSGSIDKPYNLTELRQELVRLFPNR